MNNPQEKNTNSQYFIFQSSTFIRDFMDFSYLSRLNDDNSLSLFIMKILKVIITCFYFKNTHEQYRKKIQAKGLVSPKYDEFFNNFLFKKGTTFNKCKNFKDLIDKQKKNHSEEQDLTTIISDKKNERVNNFRYMFSGFKLEQQLLIGKKYLNENFCNLNKAVRLHVRNNFSIVSGFVSETLSQQINSKQNNNVEKFVNLTNAVNSFKFLKDFAKFRSINNKESGTFLKFLDFEMIHAIGSLAAKTKLNLLYGTQKYNFFDIINFRLKTFSELETVLKKRKEIKTKNQKILNPINTNSSKFFQIQSKNLASINKRLVKRFSVFYLIIKYLIEDHSFSRAFLNFYLEKEIYKKKYYSNNNTLFNDDLKKTRERLLQNNSLKSRDNIENNFFDRFTTRKYNYSDFSKIFKLFLLVLKVRCELLARINLFLKKISLILFKLNFFKKIFKSFDKKYLFISEKKESDCYFFFRIMEKILKIICALKIKSKNVSINSFQNEVSKKSIINLKNKIRNEDSNDFRFIKRRLDRLERIIKCRNFEQNRDLFSVLRRKINCPIETSYQKDVVLINCGHVFSFRCIHSLIKKRNRRCPICSAKFSKTQICSIYLL